MKSLNREAREMREMEMGTEHRKVGPIASEEKPHLCLSVQSVAKFLWMRPAALFLFAVLESRWFRFYTRDAANSAAFRGLVVHFEPGCCWWQGNWF